MKTEILLYGTKDKFEDLLSVKPEDFFVIIFMAKKDGYNKFRIVDYTEVGIEKPDFTKVF